MTQQEDPTSQSQQQGVLSGSREAMEPLYEQLLQQAFPDSHSAVEFCRHACAEFGFTVKQEASANRNIYVYCSREGLPDSQRKPKPTPQRKRPSKRCDCRWRVVLSENNQGLWEFRKSSSPTAYEHNHEMMDPKDMIKTWPAEVNSFIIQLARQRMQTHEIRDIVKQRFPDITWNERRFYNRLTEERKRIRQRDVIDRVQRLLFLSAKLCSVVAANDDWFINVEADMVRIFDHFYHLSRLPPDGLSSLVDIPLDQITMDSDQHHNYLTSRATATPITTEKSPLSSSSSSTAGPGGYTHPSSISDNALHHHRSSLSSEASSSSLVKMELEDSPGVPTKKRKSMLLDPVSPPPFAQQQQQQQQQHPKGTHMVYVPPFTLYVRPQHSRSMSESSSSHHQQQILQPQQQQHSHRLPYADTLSSPSTMMDATSPHPQQALAFNNPSFYSLASPSSSSVSSVTSNFQQQQQRPSSSQQQPSSTTTTSATSTTTASNVFQQASSDTPHPQQQPFYMPSSSYHHPFGSGGGGAPMPLQQAAHVYSMQSFNSPYSSSSHSGGNNSSSGSSSSNHNPQSTTTGSVDPNDMPFFDHASLIPPTDTSGTPTRRPEMYRTMMDMSNPRSSDARTSSNSSSNNNNNNSNPLFMYPPPPLPSNTSPPTNEDGSPPMNIHPPSYYHRQKDTMFDHHQPSFSSGTFGSSQQQQQQQTRSPTGNDMVMDDPPLS